MQTTRKKKKTALEKIFRTRIANVRLVRKNYTSNVAFATALGVSPAFITHIIGENPIKGIGEELARDIEAKLGLPVCWLDFPK